MRLPRSRIPTLMIAMAAGLLAALAQKPGVSQDRPLPQPNHLGPGLLFARYATGSLLQNPEIQEELKLTPDQKDRLKAVEGDIQRLAERHTLEVQEARQRLRDSGAGPQEVSALAARANESAQPLREEREARLMKVLSRDQRERLEQIRLQAEGPMAFTRPEVQERLNMDPDQVALIAANVTEGRTTLSREAALPPEVRPPLTPSAEERQRVLDSRAYKAAVEKSRATALQVRTKTMQAIAKVLTKKQRATYQSLLGEPFGLERLQAKPKADGAAPSRK
jgi:Spy/CpxP family protein refolding chaperone